MMLLENNLRILHRKSCESTNDPVTAKHIKTKRNKTLRSEYADHQEGGRYGNRPINLNISNGIYLVKVKVS